MEQINCPQCQKRLLIANDASVRECQCPACGGVFRAAQVGEGGTYLLFPSHSKEAGVQAVPRRARGEEKSDDGEDWPSILQPDPQVYNHQGQPLAPRGAWFPAGRLGFAVGAVVALVVTIRQSKPPEPIFQPLFDILLFGCYCGLLAFGIAKLYQYAPSAWQCWLHAGLGTVLVLDTLYFWAMAQQGERLTLGRLYAGIMFGCWFVCVIALILGLFVLVLMFFREGSSESSAAPTSLHEPEDDPDWSEP